MYLVQVLSFDLDQEGRDTVSPPKLARNAPVNRVLEPAVPGADELVGDDFKVAGLDAVHRGLRHDVSFDVPLGLDAGFNDVTAPAADGDAHGVVLLVPEEPDLLEILDDLGAAVEPHHALVGASVIVDGALVIEDVDEGEVVPLAGIVIVGIMGGGDLHGSRTKGGIDHGVGDDDEFAVDEGVGDGLSVEGLVPHVIGVDGNGGISEHGLDTGGGDNDLLVGAIDLVGKVDQDTEFVPLVLVVTWDVHQGPAWELHVVDLQVGDGGLEPGAPVDQAG